MSMTEKYCIIKKLILKTLSQETLTCDERVLLENWVNESPANADLLAMLEDNSWLAENLFFLENVDIEKMRNDLELLLKEEKNIPWSRKFKKVRSRNLVQSLITAMKGSCLKKK